MWLVFGVRAAAHEAWLTRGGNVFVWTTKGKHVKNNTFLIRLK